MAEYSALELLGIVGGIMLALFFLLLIPRMFGVVKKKAEQDGMPAQKQWMAFLVKTIGEQKSGIRDTSVDAAWDMLLECAQTIENGYGNWGSCLDISDIHQLIRLLESNKEWTSVHIGEDLLSMEILPDGELEVSLTFRHVKCRSSLMLGELNQLWEELKAYKGLRGNPYSIETLRTELKKFCRFLPAGVMVSDMPTMFYLNDELAFPVPVTIAFPGKRKIAVILKKGSLHYLIKDMDVWVLNSELKTVEVYESSDSFKTYSVREAFETLKTTWRGMPSYF